MSFSPARSRGRNPDTPDDAPDGHIVDHCISRTVRDMHQQVTDITAAVDGAREGGFDMTGLAQLAEMLRAEVITFLDQLRG